MSDAENAGNPTISFWIIEDSTEYVEELAFLLGESEDLRCTATFGDIEELEAHLNAASPVDLPDAVLMDIQLPGKSGIEGTRYLRAQFPSLPIVMLTLHDDDENIFAALQAGASGYLLKGLPFEQTLAAIRNAGLGWMSMPDAVAVRVLGYFSAKPDRGTYQLTKREIEVLGKICDGLTHQGIADALFISPNTVNQHVKSIYEKLHVTSKPAAVAKALRERIVD